MNDDQLRPAGGEDRSVPGVDAEVVVVDSRDGGLLLPSHWSPPSHVAATATVTVCSRLTTHNVVSSATPHLAAHRRPVTATTASVAAVGE